MQCAAVEQSVCVPLIYGSPCDRLALTPLVHALFLLHSPCLVLQVKGELAVVDKTNAEVQSFARMSYQEVCEAAINEQIK